MPYSAQKRKKESASESKRKTDRENCCDNSECYVTSAGMSYCFEISSSRAQGDDYSSKQYWDKRYKDGNIEHEWYYSYELLEPIIQESRVWSSNDRVLEVGCGDKPLIQGFMGLGIPTEQLSGIDYAKSVIDVLKSQQVRKQYPQGIQFEDMDGCNMRYDNDFFDFICEKGTMDAILSNKQPALGIRNSVKLISEIIRVMKSNGVFLLVSHIEVDSEEFDVLTNEILMPALASKPSVHWKIEAHVVSQAEEEIEQPHKRQKKGTVSTLEVTESSTNGYGTVYLIRSIPRKLTRHSAEVGEISFEVKTYDE